tara:strand:+ start:398 stop:592 length:195 start_codon:yes stop_codon:yes gene_type:complete
MFRRFSTKIKHTNQINILKKNAIFLNKKKEKINSKQRNVNHNKSEISDITEEKLKEANKDIFLL